MNYKNVLHELLNYFYYKQYEHEYYPCYDRIQEIDEEGNPYYVFYINY